MNALSLHNGIGTALYKVRKLQRMSQAELATQAGVSVPTVRLLEQGQGTTRSLQSVVGALGLTLGGRNLPAGQYLGAQLALLRHRRRMGQRTLAQLVGVAHSTIVRLERHSIGRVDMLERVMVALGSGAYLREHDTPMSFFSTAGVSSVYHHWETPAVIAVALHTVCGVIDLDPCATRVQGRGATVRARVYFTPADDGLALPWFGTVFMNPPYGRTLGAWIAKAFEEVKTQRATTVIALIPARTDTAYWHTYVSVATGVLFLSGRLKFGASTQSAPFPSAVVVWGGTPAIVERLGTLLPSLATMFTPCF